jgi:hypothetical protein
MAQKDDDEQEKPFLENMTGYDPADLLKAPAKPPKPVDPSPPERGQYRSLIIGFGLVGASVVTWLLLGYPIALAILIIGVVFIIIGVMVRLD